MTVTLRYVDSPHGTSGSNSLYTRLVEEATGDETLVVTNPKAKVDLEFVSVHVPEFRRLARTLAAVRPGRNYRRRLRRHERWNSVSRDPSRLARKSIWFSGDNVRPPGGVWDGYLSFDLDPLGGRNVYFPHWWEYLGLLSSTSPSYSGVKLSPENLMSARASEPQRSRFACAFIGNPTAMRLHAIDALSKVGRVDVYGNMMGRPVPSKVDVAKHYRFVLCFENDLYPGYVTEKVFEAWATGAVPLWWGSDPAAYVNSAAVINAADFASLSEFREEVSAINTDPAAWSEMASRPILQREPDLSPAIDLVARVLS